MSKKKNFFLKSYFAVIVLIAVFIILFSMLIKLTINITSNNNNDDSYSNIDGTSLTNDDSALSLENMEDVKDDEVIKVELSKEEKKQYVLDHPDEYTEELTQFMCKYDQVIDYVYSYKDRDSVDIYNSNTFDSKTNTQFPLYIQWDSRWGYIKYGDSLIGPSGCGPTCLAMVYNGLTGKSDQTPITICKLSEDKKYYIPGSGTTWNIMTKGANDLGLKSQSLPLYENKLIEELKKGRPIICNVGPGDFTKGGHYIVIAGYTEGKFIINDPNSIDNSNKLWEFEVIKPQIKNLWSFWIE